MMGSGCRPHGTSGRASQRSGCKVRTIGAGGAGERNLRRRAGTVCAKAQR